MNIYKILRGYDEEPKNQRIEEPKNQGIEVKINVLKIFCFLSDDVINELYTIIHKNDEYDFNWFKQNKEYVDYMKFLELHNYLRYFAYWNFINQNEADIYTYLYGFKNINKTILLK